MQIIVEEKKALRRAIRKIKSDVSPSLLREESHVILTRLAQHPRFVEARTVLLYHSLPDEPHTHDFIQHWSQSKRILLPVMCGDTLELRAFADNDGLRIASKYQILEPTDGILCEDYQDIDLAVIPGVAFDAQGHRLGRGKGFYDRLLSHPAFATIYKVGICFSFQLVDKVPAEPHDCCVDEVISGGKY